MNDAQTSNKPYPVYCVNCSAACSSMHDKCYQCGNQLKKVIYEYTDNDAVSIKKQKTEKKKELTDYDIYLKTPVRSLMLGFLIFITGWLCLLPFPAYTEKYPSAILGVFAIAIFPFMVISCLYPSVIAIKKQHAHKIPILILNILGPGIFSGSFKMITSDGHFILISSTAFVWMICLIWACFDVQKS
jgi:hypothetical protein